MPAAIVKAALVASPVLVGLFAVFSSGKKGGGRAPFLNPIPVPGQDMPFEQVDEALCLCWQAGEHERGKLATCVLGRLWPDVPWPARRSDHPTVVLASNLVHDRASAFVDAMAAGNDPCIEVIDVDPQEPPGPVGPVIVDPFDPKLWVRDDAQPRSFLPLRQGDNPTLVARRMFDLNVGDSRTLAVLRCIVGTGYNLFYYSRTRDPQSYGSVKLGAQSYDIGPAYLPRNDNALDAFKQDRSLLRTVNRNGGKVAAGSSYGMPWLPDIQLFNNGAGCPGGDDPWHPDRNPPAEVLQRRNLNLAVMREEWESWGA